MLALDCEAARSLDAGVAAESQCCVWMKGVFYKEAEYTFVKPRQHFDNVVRGEVIASGTKGELVAPEDGHIILPKASAAAGDEWFFFGIRGAFPSANA